MSEFNIERAERLLAHLATFEPPRDELSATLEAAIEHIKRISKPCGCACQE
jgi:hypothetical protein